MRKKDEMEQKVANKAVKITWFVTVMALFIVGFIQRSMDGGESNVLLLIAILSTTMLISLEQYYLSKINEDSTFKNIVGITIVLAAVLLGIGWFLSR
ncbi:MAG: hypothetical protein JJU01_06070 [Alkalibacterium sp.]|nr:hypothetical protein [Alkalibacterium sp.]TVP92055.1 MAG: hypothetical protein EA249_03760 [Alkalibacterium sp.]